ncbi:MAG: ABC transporter ATP-binding protein [Fibrobacterota bacterium]
MNALHISKIQKTFSTFGRKTVALDGIDLTIEPQEFFVLLGPSGCGKSTLLNIIAGLEAPSGGEIRFGDTIFCSDDKKIMRTPRERNIAMVFQNYALYPHMTVFQNIAFPLRIAGLKKGAVAEPVRKAARCLGIENLLPSKPGHLSGGQRQRVAIARAIVREPNLFLLDEPLSNLDAQLRTSTRAELKKLQRSLGITTIYVTHDQVEAMTLGDRVAILKNGRIEQIGIPEDLYNRPANTFVARFIGSPPMNILETEVISDDNTDYVLLFGIRLPIRKSVLKDKKTVAVGIRPEHIRISQGEERHSFELEVTQIEKLGRESLVHGKSAKYTLSLLTSDPPPSMGDHVSVSFDTTKIHFF